MWIRWLSIGWYTIDGAESETIRNLAVQDRQTTVEEDIRLVESVQKGLNSRGYRPGPLVLDPKVVLPLNIPLQPCIAGCVKLLRNK